MSQLSCFKAYDIRGELGTELNEDVAYRIGRAYGVWLHSNTSGDERLSVVVGGDIRLTSESLKQALASGLMDSDIDVIDLGMTGTEEIYFATFHLGVAGGVEVTASHNPMNYNGMKLVREGARPVSGDTGLKEIQHAAELNEFPDVTARGSLTKQSCLASYVEHLMTYITPSNIAPLKLVVNSGNGAAGHVVDALAAAFDRLQIPVSFIRIHHEPDGNFPNGIPNPLLQECREDTRRAVIEHGADMGIAWDGDFDRCFLFDETGAFVEGYYIVGLLAEAFLQKQPGANIIHDPRLTWNTIDIVEASGGTAVLCKTGHAFIKERMRAEDAVYGGEMSAHHYFRDFAYCDSGMIPWLLVAELICVKQQPLSALVNERISAYPSPGEINFRLTDAQSTIDAVRKYYEPLAISFDTTDGISFEFDQWRFNLRSSNTEPVVRLNLETRGDSALMASKLAEISQFLEA
ncbi:phosphomannomutase CpsG [Leucothrix arctica]|uniref:phosphomannomutase n=1 Tax=Leucothrix arctica TaxID=1481894 RepID=A0A317CRA2_9GAMM|nr:phosphomannomutase CpsG [Leucothrix arctica]PWQ98822.1 phosphomannomutase CpsG [Leucothrix arctica]